MNILQKLNLARMRFPIKVVVYVRYKNLIKPFITKGIYKLETNTYQGGAVSTRVYYFKNGPLDYVQIPYVPQKYIEQIQETGVLSLLKVDINTYYPISFEYGKMVYDEIKQITDEDGQPKRNEKGELLYTTEPHILLDATIVKTKDGIKEIPYAVGNEAIDPEQWAEYEHEKASRKYAHKTWLEQWGVYLMPIIAIIGCILIIKFMFDGFNGLAQKIGESMVDASNTNTASSQAIQNATQALMDMMKQLPKK